MTRTLALLGLVAALFLPAPVAAQLSTARVVTLQAARTIAQAAEAEARRNSWNVAIAVVDASGELIHFHRIDGTQLASTDVAIGKARTAARFKRPTKALEESLLGGRTVVLALEGAMPIEGGLPLEVDGQVIGAIGVSGVTAVQDAQVARAGVAALKP